VLLAFDLVAAGVAALAPAWTRAAGRLAARLPTRPLPAAGLLVVLSAAAYVPLALAVGPLAWFTFGPFTAQTSRVLHYAVYFAAGMVVGATDLRAGLLDAGGALARRWSWWTIAALLAFVGSLVVFTLAAQHPTRPLLVGAAGVFVISCACSSVALLASFLRWLATPRAWLDHLGRHAYGIYLLHYAAVTWIQYALLAATVPASVKAIVVFVTAVGATWLVTTAVRRIPAVARIV
jgi:peptidoglycan/LPS O-acetylase OafA/YrhL